VSFFVNEIGIKTAWKYQLLNLLNFGLSWLGIGGPVKVVGLNSHHVPS
jgi:hypothetical protein